jgi:hypothetical protein
MLRTLISCGVATVVAASLQAAQPTGSMKGSVLDADGGLVSRLETDFTLTESATGKTVKGHLDRDGHYVVGKLPAGSYSVDLVLPSRLYDRYQRANVVVAPGKTLELDLHIPWGMNLGTFGDDPLLQGADLRAKTKNVDGPIDRLPDGHPDLSGVWTSISDGFAPPAMPMKPWAQAMADELSKLKQDNAGAYCLPQVAVPTLMAYPMRFVVARDRIVQLIEDMDPGYRQFFMDGRPHPDPAAWNPAWYGHSVAHWEGDTLVVDTTGFNEITPGFGIHTENLHTVEKYTRISHGRMQVELFAEDPDAWTAPHTRKWMLGLVDDTEIVEFVCAEGHASEVSKRAPWKGRP